MNLKHYKDPHIAVAVAATAVVCSPKARAVLRRGAVYGLAGALRAGDALATFARGVGRGVQETAASSAVPTAATQPSVAAEMKPEFPVASAPAHSTETASNE
ncbi:MAG: hypothetical protein ABR526_14180 [Chthoniobacterales bacterium]